jgi:hypothetical protein
MQTMTRRYTLAPLLLLALTGLTLVGTARADTVVLNPTADARILSVFPTSSFSDLLSVYNVGTNIQRTLIQFDLSSIPAGSTVTSATLTLFQGASFFSASQSVPTSVYRVTRPWSEAQTTWNVALGGTPWTTPGGDYVGTTGQQNVNPYLTQSDFADGTQRTYNYTLTNLVTEWVGGTANNGLLLLANQPSELVWQGRRESAAAFRPTLTVNFTPGGASVNGPEPGTLALLPTGLAVFLLARRKPARR